MEFRQCVRSTVLGFLLAATASTALAQPVQARSAYLNAGWNFVFDSAGNNEQYPLGFRVGVGCPLNDRLAIDGEFTWNKKSYATSAETFLFMTGGVRIAMANDTAHARPFVEGRAGLSRDAYSAYSQWGSAFIAGGGVQIPAGKLWIEPKGDLLIFHIDRYTHTGIRISVSVGFPLR